MNSNITITVAISLGYLLLYGVFLIAWLMSDRKVLKQQLEEARADRNKAWDRISELHAERVADIHKTTDRINRMTTIRETNNAVINNATKEN